MIKRLSLILPVVALSACTSFQILSEDDLKLRGTKIIPNAKIEAVTEAGNKALRSLGFEIAQKEIKVNLGILKTTPRDVMNINRDEMAWTMILRQQGNDVHVLARPRAFRNGNEMIGKSVFAAEIMDPKFQALFRELDESMSLK